MDSNQQNELSYTFKQGRISILNTIAFVVVVVLLGFFGFYKYQEYLNNQQIALLKSRQAQAQQEIKELEDKSLSEIFVAYNAVEELKQLSFLWSRFVKLITTVTPEDIFYRSFGVSTSGDVSVAAFAPTFESVAALIRILETQPAFSEVFVPSVARGRDRTDLELISFNVMMNYSQLDEGERRAREQIPAEEAEVSETEVPKNGEVSESGEVSENETETAETVSADEVPVTNE